MKLEINYKRRMGKNTTEQRLNMLLGNPWVNKEIKEENKKHLEISESGNKTYRRL